MRPAPVGVALVVFASALATAQEPTLDEVLARAAKYVRELQSQLSGIVIEEQYQQNIVGSSDLTSSRSGPAITHRELKSDLLLVQPSGSDRWVQFRDVFEVDGRSVRDRDARLEKLFLTPSSSAYEHAQKIASESARYNIGSVERTVNLPVMALTFLRHEYRPRFLFKRVGAGNVRPLADLVKKADDIWAVEYQETLPETLIRTVNDGDLPARGRFWIDAPTGRVLRSELQANDGNLMARVEVVYRLEPGLGFLVPDEMREQYTGNQARYTILGRATYGRFKRFTVTTEEAVKKPGG
jgi:hypothetical protein